MCMSSYGTSSASVSAMRSRSASGLCSESTSWKTAARRRYDSTSASERAASRSGSGAGSGTSAAFTATVASVSASTPAWISHDGNGRVPRSRDVDDLKLGLAVPVVEPLDAPDHPDSAQVDLVGARVVDDVVRLPRPVGEVRQPRLACNEGVGDARPRRAGDDVPRPHGDPLEPRRPPDPAAELDLPLLVAEEQRASTLQHDEQLLLGGMTVRRPAHL